jgi:hypothetical protein
MSVYADDTTDPNGANLAIVSSCSSHAAAIPLGTVS